MTKKQWTAVLKDGIKISIEHLDPGNQKDKISVAMEVGKQKIRSITRLAGERMSVSEARMILSITVKSIVARLSRNELEVIIAKKDGELIGFVINHGILEEAKLLEKLDPTGKMTREESRIIVEGATMKYNRKGLNRCLILMTLLSRPEKIFYTPITSEHAKGLVKMFKNIADTGHMKFDQEEAKGQYGVDLIKNKDSNKFLKQMLESDYQLKEIE